MWGEPSDRSLILASPSDADIERCLVRCFIRRSLVQRRARAFFAFLFRSPQADHFQCNRLVGVLITPEENAVTFSSSFPLGVRASRGHSPGYWKASPIGQGAPASPAKVPAQRVRAQLPASLFPPALLSAPGMLARAAPLARSATAGGTSQGRQGQGPARPGGESAPPAIKGHGPGR
jgi:hypothetical protein